MRALVGTAVLLVALAGCGDDGGDDADVEAEPAPPACADLARETITEGFAGCTEDGELETVTGAYDCVDGRRLSIVGDDLGWAFVDEEWHEGSSADALDECYGVGEESAEPSEATEQPSEEPSDEPTEEATDEPDDPAVGSLACEDVWTEGATLPPEYVGCKEGRRMVPAALFECEDGRQLTGYDDRFYAFVGEEILPTSDGDAYADAFADCIG